MRIVIDMQGAQTESRFRGIGRYTTSLAQAIVRNRGEHEIILALSGLFPDTIEPIRAAFDELLPQENIRVWHAPGPVRECEPSNEWRREVAERIREAFLASLRPDVVLVSSLFEGFGDDAVTSVGVLDTDTPVAVILYDLIPLISPDVYFKTSKLHRGYYYRKLAHLKRSQRLLAISASARDEAICALDFDAQNIFNISGACDTSFQILSLSYTEKKEIFSKTGITRSFVMYTGGADERKNLHRLIHAYALLPKNVREAYQLVLVGKMPEGSINDLMLAARKNGLARDEIVITGYVEDTDLVKLYNSCSLFVFPSLHEGFGIPPLEAMLCGAPVIAANVTSLPEVIGREDALFDPKSVTSIRDKIKQALTDEAFRASLIAHGQVHAKTFSWDESAKRALSALQEFGHGTDAQKWSSLYVEKTSIISKQDKKILLLKLDHMGDLILAIPAITKLKARYPYASIDIVCGSWCAPIARTLKLFDNIHTFDFFKTKSAESVSTTDSEVNALLDKLGNYDIAIDLRRQRDTRFLLVKTNAKLKVGYETFDPDIDSKLDISICSYPDMPFETTPLNRTSITVQMLRLIDALPNNINDYISFPELVDKKETSVLTAVAIFPDAGNDVKEWDKSNYIALVELLEQDTRIQTINVYFANANEAQGLEFKPGEKLHVHCGLDFQELSCSLSSNIVCVANNSFGVHLASYLGLMVIGIYAGQESVSEWAPVFGNSYVIHNGASCSPCHIAKRSDCTYDMSCLNDIPLDFVYHKIMEAVRSVSRIRKNEQSELIPIISLNKGSDEIINRLINSIADLSHKVSNHDQSAAIAMAISLNHPPNPRTRQLLVDISELVQRDAGTGIQRVTRSILKELLESPPEGYSVEPVYATADTLGYRYARNFTARFRGEKNELEDEAVDAWPGDIFLGLDLQPVVVAAQKEYLLAWHRSGIEVFFVIYDLLPVLLPHFFPDGAQMPHQRWLETISHFDGAVCISRAVADALATWQRVHCPQRLRPFKIDWFHLGADLENSVPTRGLPDDANQALRELARRPTFLTVGTVEPRKGQVQVVETFELRWKDGVDANLVIIGKQGWLAESLAERLRKHPELNKRLFWLEGISDEYLEKIYATATCLIAASEGEGFGLPLIEAAQHKLPIIARDIPVFREVAGDHAFYFNGLEPQHLSETINNWLVLDAKGKAPQSTNMPWLTWKQSAERLKQIIVEGDWYKIISAKREQY